MLRALARPDDERAVAEAIAARDDDAGRAHSRFAAGARARLVASRSTARRSASSSACWTARSSTSRPSTTTALRGAPYAIGRPSELWAAALAAAREADAVSASSVGRARGRLGAPRRRRRRVLRRRRLLARRGARACARSVIARSQSPLSRPRSRAASSTARAWSRERSASRTRSSRPTSSPGPAIARNDRYRCYHCKTELYDALAALAQARVCSAALGANADDAGDWRPGLAPPPTTEWCIRCWRPASARPRCARCARARGPERRQARQPVPRLARALRHAGRPRRSRASTLPSRPCARSASGCSACATTASSASSSCPTSSARPRRRPARAIGEAMRSAGYTRAAIDTDPFRSGTLNVAFLGRTLTVLEAR